MKKCAKTYGRGAQAASTDGSAAISWRANPAGQRLFSEPLIIRTIDSSLEPLSHARSISAGATATTLPDVPPSGQGFAGHGIMRRATIVHPQRTRGDTECAAIESSSEPVR